MFTSQHWARQGVSFAASALFVLVMLSGAAFAQTETGQIIGEVKDPNGALVAGAAVSVKSVETGVERTATTQEDGTYVVTNLQPGLYDVTVNATGFAAKTQQANVTVGSQVSVITDLAVTGIAGETVEVIAGGGVEVNTTNAELSNVVSGTQIRELPSLTRNPYDFVALSGNVASDPNGSTGRGVGFAINGQRASSTNILLDGADNNNTFSATVGQSVPLDSVQEYRVLTSNFSAEYGRATGGVINLSTRAGGNNFFGSLYEFNRISRLASNGFANNADGLERAVFTRNQFGYAVGGPIVRDKLFFFNSTEWLRVRSTAPLVRLVPTSQLLAASAPATRAFFGAYGNLNATPTGRVLSVADVIAARNLGAGAFASLPGTLPAFQEVQYQTPTDAGGGSPVNSYQTVIRIDYNLSDKTQIYGRYALEDNLFFTQGVAATSPYEGFSPGSTDFNNNMLVSLTHSFSSNLVSQTKLVYNRLNNFSPLGDAGFVPTLYFFPNTGSSIAGTPVALPGLFPSNPGVGGPFGGPQNLGQVFQDFNYQAGKHQFRFGGQYVYIQDNRTFGAYSTASATLGLQGNYTSALNNFVLGQLRQFQSAVNPQGQFPGGTVRLPVTSPDFTRSNRYNEFALYVNDNYRVTSNVTLNLGLRYEFYGVQRNKNRNVDSNFYFGSGSNIFEQIRSGSVQIVPDSPIGEFYEPDKNNFAPRLGFAWDIFGDGSTSLRGGYGLSYERNFGNVTFNVIQNPPNYAVISVFAPDDFATIPIPVDNAGPLAGSGVSRILPPTSLRNLRPDLKTAYSHSYSLAVERRIGEGTVASVEFSASQGRKLYSLENLNRVGTAPRYLGNLSTTPSGGTSSRLNGQYTNLNTRGNGGRSNYAGLVFGVESSNLRATGLQFTARYTLSKAKDNLSSTFSEADTNFNLGFLDPFNPDLDYGNADFDVRHRFSGSVNYTPTFFRDRKGFAKYLLDGYTFTGIVTARTGTPFTVFDCTNAITTCLRLAPTGALPDTQGASAPDPDPTVANRFIYLNLSNQTPSTFTDVSGGTEVGPFPDGMTERNAFRGPGAYNIDAAVHKNFNFNERYRLQLRLETFNLLNHANLFLLPFENEINTSFGPTGDIRGVAAQKSGRRNVQLAVKFIF